MIKKQTPTAPFLLALTFLSLTLVGILGFPERGAASFYTPDYPIKASDFSLVRRDGIFHVFYTVNCFEANAICDDTTIGHATSPDLTTWTRQPNVLENGTGFDADEMWAPEVIQSNGTYYMFYAGVDYNGTAYVQKIGLARSNDLVTWEKDPRSPIVNCDNFSWAYWDEGTAWRAECRDPSVFWDAPNSRWIMTVSGRPVATPTRMIIGLASSTDLVTWTELGTVPLTQTASAKAESSSMLYRDGQYLLHWTTATAAVYSTSTSPSSTFATLGSFDDGVGFATEIRQVDGVTVYAEAYSPELHFQEFLWGSGVSFTIGELPYGSISGKVFRDADGDGSFDSGESGIGSVAVQLYIDDGDGVFEPARADFLVDSRTTSTTGDYTFATALPEAFWIILPSSNEGAGQPLAGFRRTSGAASAPYFGNPRSVTVARTTASAGQDFGFVALGTIQGTIWNDADRDGTEDAGEGGFANVTVNLTGTEGTGRTVFRQATTDAAGTFTFSALSPGTYSATVADLTGVLGQYTLTSGSKEDTTVDTTNIALADGETHTTADFGYATLGGGGSIAGLVWNDANGNSRRENGEAGLSGVTVQLTRDSDGNGAVSAGESVQASLTTPASGVYSFTNLPAAAYLVTILSSSVPSGYQFTGSSSVLAVTLAAGQSVVEQNFGYRQASATQSVGLSVPSVLGESVVLLAPVADGEAAHPPVAAASVVLPSKVLSASGGARAAALPRTFGPEPFTVSPGPPSGGASPSAGRAGGIPPKAVFGGGWPSKQLAASASAPLGTAFRFPAWLFLALSLFLALAVWNVLERRQRVSAIAGPGTW